MRLVGVYGSYREGVAAAKSLGLVAAGATRYIGSGEALEKGCPDGVSAVAWAPLSSHSPGEAIVDVYGEKGFFAFNNSGCLRSPSIAERFLALVEKLASRGCGIVVDALRYPSPLDGRLFLSCFCPHCLAQSPGSTRLGRS